MQGKASPFRGRLEGAFLSTRTLLTRQLKELTL